MDNVFISGITGQDGIFLTSNLLKNNPDVKIYGTSRKVNNLFHKKLTFLDSKADFSRVEVLQADLSQDDNVLELFKTIKPSKIFNLTGPSSPSESMRNGQNFEFIINKIYDNLLKASNLLKKEVVFFQPSSSETFSNQNKGPLSETSLMEPRSPYGRAKYELYMKSLELREKKGIDIRNGILFNHESEFRNNNFLIMKIIDSAIKIKSGVKTNFELGSLDYTRDWSHASDIVKAMVKITYDTDSSDYVVGSGIGHKIKDIVEIVFENFNLNYTDHLSINPELLRLDDPISIVSNPSKIMSKLDWKPKISFEETILKCISFKTKEDKYT
tara:strand:- start:906 stop:1889 length:984 start_codon:yes stop_codon:yes gene_type:complete